MTIMEPDLILNPILERAIPSLESLIEVNYRQHYTFRNMDAHIFLQTERTMAVIGALDAVAQALVSRDTYYAGSKHLVPLLQHLLPGIDLVRPNFVASHPY